MNRSGFLILLLSAGLFFFSCSTAQKEKHTDTEDQPENPAAEGFNAEASDEQAIEVADKVMKAMGGRTSWDNTRYISWNFFGNRELLWDKATGRVRIEIPKDSIIFTLDIDTNEGDAYIKGTQINEQDSLSKLMKRAKGIWINDSYWLVMPFKLKDSGVTLTYKGLSETNEGTPAHVLELNFDNVGYTPQNKYEVYVDTTDHLVKQWAFFRSAEQDSATAVWPWDNYQQHGDILISADRSDNRGPGDVKVYDQLPDSVFTTQDFILSEL